MRIRVLGECVIQVGNREITPSAPHLFALLLRLGSEPGHYLQRQELADLLFASQHSADAVAHSIRQLIYQASQKGAPIHKLGGAIALAAPSVCLDVDELTNHDPPHAGLALRSLSVLPGYVPNLSESYSDWLDQFRAQQQGRLRHSLITTIDNLRRRGEWRAVEARAHECLGLDPLNETATLALAEALARTGSKERAIAILNDYSTEVGNLSAPIALPAKLLQKRIENVTPSSVPAEAQLPLVGMGDSLSSLHEQWHLAKLGRVQCALVRGEPGSGKSRIVDEFLAHLLLAGGNSVAVVRKTGTEPFRPLALLADLIPTLMKMPGAAGCDPELVPFLHRLAGTHPPQHLFSAAPGDAQFVSSSIIRAIVDLLEALCAERPCAIVIDDSRAFDDESLGVVRSLIGSSASLRLFLIVVGHQHCTESVTRLPSRTINLTPLTVDDSQQLLASYSSASAVPLLRDDISWCTNIAAGNPAFLLMLAAQCARSGDHHAIPRDIVSAADQRLEALTPSARHVLETSAVLADDCDPGTLAHVIGLSPFDLVTALSELEHDGLIVYDETRIRLRSTLFRDRTLQAASRSVLALLHGRAAEALEHAPAGLNSQWRIATHWRLAGKHQKARSTLTASWQRSLQLGQPKHAEASIREYLAQTVDPAERVTLYDDLIEVTQAAGNSQETIKAIDERQAIIESIGVKDSRREELDFDRLDSQLHDYADPALPERDLLRFMRSPTLDVTRRLRAAVRLIVSADATVNSALALEVFGSLAGLEANDSTALEYRNQAVLIFHSVFGDKSVARDLARSMLDGTETPHSGFRVRAKLNASLALQLVSADREGITQLEELYPRVAAAGVTPVCVFLASRIASYRLDDGDVLGATEWADVANAHVRSGLNGRLPADYLSVRADLAILRGDYAEASRLIETMRDGAPVYHALRYRMELLSYSMRLAQYQGAASDVASTQLLLEWHHRAKCFGRHDDAMEALWTALTEQGKQSHASELLRDYIFLHRREGRSCRFMLRRRTDCDPVWDSAAIPSQSKLRGSGALTEID